MSLHLLAVGTLTSDPTRRTSQAGKDFATGNMRVATEGEPVLVSVIAFGDRAQDLLAHHRGSTVAVSGRAKLSSWAAPDGAVKHGISIVVEQIASAASARRADDKRRGARQ